MFVKTTLRLSQLLSHHLHAAARAHHISLSQAVEELLRTALELPHHSQPKYEQQELQDPSHTP